MTEFLLGITITILFPRVISALRRAWEDAAPVQRPAPAETISPEKVVEAVRGLPPDPEILGQLADALRSLREKVETTKK